MKFKTLAHGISKSRSGSPSIRAHTLAARKGRELADAAPSAASVKVSNTDVLNAARTLSESKGNRLRRYGSGAVIGAATAPAVTLSGNVAEVLGTAAKNLHGGRRAAIGSAVAKSLSRPQVAKDLAKGVVTGSGVQAIREGVELRHAKKTVSNYLRGNNAVS